MQKERNNKTRNIILTIFGILIFCVIGTLAVIRDSNDVSQYMVRDNITINNSGMYYGGEKAFAKTADVVVCRGTSILDDYIKRFSCDIVCESTDNNCTDELKKSLTNTQGLIVWRPGNYNVHIGSNYIKANSSNINLQGYGAILNITYEAGNGYSVLNFGEISNINIEGITMNGNNGCGTNCEAVHISGCNNVRIANMNLTNMKQFGIVVNAVTKNSSNILVENNYIQGFGTNDLIGGGTNGVQQLFNAVIRGNKAVQVLSSGSYSNAIDLAGCNHCSIENNIAYGSVGYGNEQITRDSYVLRNYVYPAVNTTQVSGNIMGSLATSTGNTFQDNIIEQGILTIPDSSSFIIHNIVKNSSGDNYISGSNNQIKDNVINITINDYGLNLGSSNGNLVENNYIYHTLNGSTSYGIYAQGNSHTLRNNYVKGGLRGIVLALGGGYNHIIDGNTVIWNGLPGDRGIVFEGNSIAKNNYVSGFTNGILFSRQESSIYSNVISNATNGVFLTSSSDSGVVMQNSSVYSNDFQRCTYPVKPGNNVQENANYLERWSYTVAINARPCNASNTFEGRTIYNASTSCLCANGVITCWVRS